MIALVLTACTTTTQPQPATTETTTTQPQPATTETTTTQPLPATTEDVGEAGTETVRGHGTATIEISGSGRTSTTVELPQGLWIAESSVRSNAAGYFVVLLADPGVDWNDRELLGTLHDPSVEVGSECNRNRLQVALADAGRGETLVYSPLAVRIGPGVSSWCRPGHIDLEVRAEDDWTVVFTDLSGLLGDVGDIDAYTEISEGVVPMSDWGYVLPRVEPTEGVFTQISVGDGYACGLTEDRAVECWGAESWRRSRPPRGEFVQVAVGDRHGCALDGGGAVACWGQTAAPEGVFTQIVADRDSSCALRPEGTYTCWGRTYHLPESPPGPRVVQLSEDGQCNLVADGTLTCSDAPAGTFKHVGDRCGVRNNGTVTCWRNDPADSSAFPGGTFVQTSDLCGITTGGAIECWGTGQYGRANEPHEPPEGTFVQISAGPYDACGLRSDGSVKCWGRNYQQGPPPPDGAFAQVSVGEAQTCGITVDGTLECWDRRFVGITFDEDGQEALDPNGLPDGTFRQLSVGGVLFDSSLGCGVRTDGTLACWEYRGPEDAPEGRFLAVSVGDNMACAVRVDASIDCWGFQGLNPPPEPPDIPFEDVSVDFNHACGLTTGGSLHCWGSGRNPLDEPPPGDDPPTGTFSQVSISDYRACALTDGGEIRCWSRVTRTPAPWPGVPGYVDARGPYVPADPPDGTFTQVSVTESYACGLRTGGRVECWGAGTIGRSGPPQASFAQISVGPFYACGVRDDGAVQCWG